MKRRRNAVRKKKNRHLNRVNIAPGEAVSIRRERRYLACLLLVLSIVTVSYSVYTFGFRTHYEPETELTETNREAALYAEEETLINKIMLQMPETASLIQKTYTVPGLNATRTLAAGTEGISMCTTMTPQGMAVTEKYLFISAYCHHLTHNSVLYMLDRESGELIREIVLQGKDHCGGMAYDPEHQIVWVSGGTTGSAKAVGYSLQSLEEYSLDESMEPLEPLYRYTLATITRNSYMNYADKALYIGYFTKSGLSQLQRLNLTEEGGLNAQIIDSYDSRIESVMADYTVETSGQVQGVAVYAGSDPAWLMLSKSFGVYDSTLQFYNFDLTSYRDELAEKVTRLPMKLEQITVADGQLYCLFESGAYPYRTQPGVRVDRVLVFNVKDMIPETEEEIVDIADIADTEE